MGRFAEIFGLDKKQETTLKACLLEFGMLFFFITTGALAAYIALTGITIRKSLIGTILLILGVICYQEMLKIAYRHPYVYAKNIRNV